MTLDEAMNQSGWKDWLKISAVAVLYVLLAVVCLAYVAPNGVVSVFWPPSGLALAALLIGGRRYAYGVLLGAFLANGLVSHTWLLAVPIALGNTLEALLGAWLLRRGGQFDQSFRSTRDYLRMIFWAGFVACSVAALNGSTLLFVSGIIASADYLQNLLHWWMGDVLGVVLFTPLILIFCCKKIDQPKIPRTLEVAMLFGGTFLLGQVVFMGWFHDALGQFARGYVMFLLVAWVAVWFGKRGTLLVLLMIALQALYGAYQGVGYFQHDIEQTGLFNYWLYMMILSVIGMALATFVSERVMVEQRVLASEQKLRGIIDASPVPKALNDHQHNITFLNPAFIQTFGYTLQDIPTVADWLHQAYPDPVYRQWVMDAWQARIKQAKLTGEKFETLEINITCKDGTVKTVMASATTFKAGQESEHLVVLYDITERNAAEAQLRIAARAFETREAIMITDPDQHIVRVNGAFERITGYASAEVIGHTPHMFSSGRHDRTFFEEMWQELSDKDFWEGEIWDKRKNGEIYPKWLTITAVRDATQQISNYVAIFSDIGQRKQAEEEIYSLAYYDALTKLPNRRLFQDRFELALAASERNDSYGALLFLDLDKFKVLNDTLGHSYGDLLLIEVAMRLKSCVREMDTIARMGGDEFVVLVEDIAADAVEASQKVAHLAEKIRAALVQPYRLEQYEQYSSPSIGVCLFRGRDETVTTLLKHADMAMYQAKDAGRNAVRFFDPVMQHEVESRVALESDLRHAVQDRQLQLYYQIQLDDEFHPLGAEALLRWIHPQRGMVSPGLFIPLAEESNLIIEIGSWVFEESCRQLQRWQEQELTRELTLSVNVSAQQFMRPDFVAQVEAVLRKYQVNPSLLKLELTESVVLDDVKGAIVVMHALKGLGVKLSMDDFGTGYSSLSYLKRLPLDQLKIDQSFVRDISSDPNDAVLVQTIIDLARNFRLNVIAEGVETEAQLTFLKEHGCMAYQGYLFSKPVQIDQFEELLRDKYSAV